MGDHPKWKFQHVATSDAARLQAVAAASSQNLLVLGL